MIERRCVANWSGVGNIEAALAQKFVEAEDFMDPAQCHYGQACQVDEQQKPIAVISIEPKAIPVIVIADEPLQMTVIATSSHGHIMIVKWVYGDSEEEFESFLDSDNIFKLEGWNTEFRTLLHSGTYLLLDSSEIGFDYDQNNSIPIEIEGGEFEISSLTYSPNENTSMVVHRFTRQDNSE